MTETKGRKERKELVAELQSRIENAKSVVFTEYHGLSASQISDLRSKLRDLGAEAGVARNKLLSIALNKDEVELKGPTMTVFANEDPIAAIKVLFDFSKEHEDLPVIKSGVVEGKVVSAKELEVLSNLPSKEQLIAQVVGGFKSPITGIVGVLGGVQRNFVYAMAEIAKTKENA